MVVPGVDPLSSPQPARGGFAAGPRPETTENRCPRPRAPAGLPRGARRHSPAADHARGLPDGDGAPRDRRCGDLGRSSRAFSATPPIRRARAGRQRRHRGGRARRARASPGWRRCRCPTSTPRCRARREATTSSALDGVMLLSNVAGTYLGDPALEPLLAALTSGRRTCSFILAFRRTRCPWSIRSGCTNSRSRRYGR